MREVRPVAVLALGALCALLSRCADSSSERTDAATPAGDGGAQGDGGRRVVLPPQAGQRAQLGDAGGALVDGAGPKFDAAQVLADAGRGDAQPVDAAELVDAGGDTSPLCAPSCAGLLVNARRCVMCDGGELCACGRSWPTPSTCATLCE